MSGKFWGASDEDEEDFFSESESDEEEDEEEEQTVKENDKVAARKDKWAKNNDYNSDDEGDDKREARSKNERINDTLNKQVEKLNSEIEKNDWNAISKEFEELNKISKRWCTTWSTQIPSPRYIGKLIELEEFIAKSFADAEYKKSLSPTNLKSLTLMSQKIKKNNASYAKNIKEYLFKQKQVEEGVLAKEDLVKVVKPAPVAAVADKEPEKKEIVWTADLVDKKLEKLISSRGKKGYDRKAQIEKLKKLLGNAQNNEQICQIHMHIISGLFDTASIASHLGKEIWHECVSHLTTVLDIVKKDPAPAKPKKQTAIASSAIDLRTNLIHFLERLEQEYFKSLQDLEPQRVTSYVKRMQDVVVLIDLAKRVQEVYTKWNNMKAVVVAVIIQMKYQHQVVRLSKPVNDDQVSGKCKGMAHATSEELDHSVKICFSFGDERQKTHAVLYYISYLANTDRYHKARDLMLMSHLQDTVSNTDIDTQILHNRAMVFVGLAAFRAGNIYDAHSSLAELCSSVRLRELLAQGTTRYSDKGAEQEKIESRRQMPYHMHINLDVLEFTHLICALLLEVPNLAAYAFDMKRKPISRNLRKYIENADRQIFVGPPELTRDYIVAAARALTRGDWKKSVSLVSELKVWKFIPESDRLKAMVTQKIKEEGLRTFLFTAGTNYDSLSTKRLLEMFELDQATVHSIVSKMIFQNELHASWDETSSCIVMHKVEPSRLQTLSLQFAEKGTQLVENNERLYELRTSFHKYDSNKDRSGQNQNQRQNRRPNNAGGDNNANNSGKRYTNQQGQQGQQGQQQRQRYNNYNKDSNNNNSGKDKKNKRAAN